MGVFLSELLDISNSSLNILIANKLSIRRNSIGIMKSESFAARFVLLNYKINKKKV